MSAEEQNAFEEKFSKAWGNFPNRNWIEFNPTRRVKKNLRSFLENLMLGEIAEAYIADTAIYMYYFDCDSKKKVREKDFNSMDSKLFFEFLSKFREEFRFLNPQFKSYKKGHIIKCHLK